MSILRVFPRRNAFTPHGNLVAVGAPADWLGTVAMTSFISKVEISCVFSWDKEFCETIAPFWAAFTDAPVEIGGPAFGSPALDFEPGRYVAKGVTFTSRGCPGDCPWCIVPKLEGPQRELPDFAPGHIIQDNNLLACSKMHRRKVYAMLRSQKRRVRFGGGLEAGRLTDWDVEQMRSLLIDEVFLASDSDGSEISATVKRAIRDLRRFLPRRRVRVYTLVGWRDDTPAKAEGRLEALWAAGVLPFAQFFRALDAKTKPPAPPAYRALVRNWSRPAIMAARHCSQL